MDPLIIGFQWFTGVATLFCILIILLTWFNVAVLPECEFTTKRIGYFSVFALLFFTLSTAANTYLRITSGYKHEDDLNHWISSIVYSLTWALGQSFVYLLFIERLKYSFKGTRYAHPQRYFLKFYVMIALFLIDSTVFQVIFALKHLGVIKGPFVLHSGEVRDIGQTLIDCVLSIGLLYEFNRKLFVLQRDVTKYDLALRTNMTQSAIMQIAARLTVISSFAIVSTQLLMLYTTVVYEYCLYADCQSVKYSYLKPIADAFWSIDCFINCLCIFLSFDFVSSMDAYYAMCWICDSQCIKCCAEIAERSLQDSLHDMRQPMLNGNGTGSSLLAGGTGGKTVRNLTDSTANFSGLDSFEPETELSSKARTPAISNFK